MIIKTLKLFKKKKLNFIIKKYQNGHLKKRLEKFTDRKIIELEPFKKKKINEDFTVAIIPQLISNVRDLPDDIQYDLDTSIVIQSNKDKNIFYNNVDMPINKNVLNKINNFIKKNFGKKVDVFCCALGAASEFPQTFLNLNRSVEKKNIIKKSLKNLTSFIDILEPKVFFPAGGTYTIYGKYNKLNKYIAQPNFKEISKILKDRNLRVFDLIGGNTLSVLENEIQYIERFKKDEKFKSEFINKTSKLKYYYQKNKSKITTSQIEKIFNKAKANYFKILDKKGIKNNWNISFNIYKNLEINKNCQINKSKSQKVKKFNLKSLGNNLKKTYKLDCYMEIQLFKALLEGKFPWNTSLSGSTIFFKRYPNEYNINQVFSLNFLRI